MTSAAEPFTHVYRFLGPRRGQRCRIVKVAPIIRDTTGVAILNTGEHTWAVEFEDGAREAVARQAVVPAASRAGRQTIAKVARGGKRKRPDRIRT